MPNATALAAVLTASLALPLIGARAQVPPAPTTAAAPLRDSATIAALKRALIADVDARQRLTQQIVDQLFSYAELGFQETESARYLVDLLRRNGFSVREAYAGVPTAWVATWGSGKPVISLGSDVDGIPRASQTPGVAWHKPLVEGGPGHGEGHNTGLAVNITAALAVKKVLEREKLPGTIQLWPGVAEELLGTKAFFVREGLFRDVDVALFAHVGSNLSTAWGPQSGTGLISAEFRFEGTAAHSAGAPWRGRSALDAVELMNIGWNFRREHLPTEQRSHYVIREGGDQPNVVPTQAAVWYYFRQVEAPRIREMFELGQRIAQGAAQMTDTKLARIRILGTAWPQHFNRPMAQAMSENIRMVGLPQWSDADQRLARAVQKEVGGDTTGLDTALARLDSGVSPRNNRGGGSDDIGDVSWTLPTITLRYPANIPNLPGHHWSSAVASATPIAHKGATAGAKAQALMVLDLLVRPQLIADAWSYFRDVQTRTVKYEPLMRPEDRPAIELNAAMMAEYRPRLRRFYYDPAKYATYLEQLGVTYPMTMKP